MGSPAIRGKGELSGREKSDSRFQNEKPTSVGGLSHHRMLLEAQVSEGTKDLIEQVGDLCQRSATVQEVGDCAKQITEQVSCARLRGDIQDDLIEVNLKSEQVQIKRA